MFAVLLKLTPVFIFALPGVIALALNPTSRRATAAPPSSGYSTISFQAESGATSSRALLGAVLSSLIAVMNSVSTLAVRDFVLRFRPGLGGAGQIALGRLAIIAAMLLGAGAAAVIAWQPEGIYKYLQTISLYLVMPLTPPIVFGILSKRVTFAGAAASFFSGLALSALFVTDALIKDKAMASACFRCFTARSPKLHLCGLWGNVRDHACAVRRLRVHKKDRPGKARENHHQLGRQRRGVRRPVRLAIAAGRASRCDSVGLRVALVGEVVLAARIL